MPLPLVAIVGRPNVGKSSLLNALAGRRISIVDPIPGITRDRVSALIEHDDVHVELIDTGGFGIDDKDNLTDQVEAQIRYAITAADLILFVVDIHDEITPLDRRVADMLRSHHDRVLLVANKADAEQHERAAGILQRLGYGEPFCISALHQRNVRALREAIISRIGRRDDTPVEPVMKLAIVGRQNVGKSTFVNQLAQAERMIVSEIPGTTRDAVDVRFERDGRAFLAIDTAGIRKQAKRDQTGIDFYSSLRAQDSILRADVVLLLLDATAKITTVDKKLAALIMEHHKPTVIVINKWDLAKADASSEAYGEYLAKLLPALAHAPLAFTTANQGRNTQSTIDLAMELFKQAQTRVTTGQLNRALAAALAERQPPVGAHGHAPRIYYATQVAVCPPTIVFFVNNPMLMREDYRRFLVKSFRESLPFPEIPIRFIWRARTSDPARRAAARSQADLPAAGLDEGD